LIAFAFSEVLASWGRIIKRWRQVKFSGLYLATSILLLLALFGHWLGMSDYRALPVITPAESLLVFSPSFVGALAAFILAPEFPESHEIDLTAHYFAVAPWVFSLFALFSLLSALSDQMVLGQTFFPFWVQLARIGVLLVPAFSKRAPIHAAALITTVAAPFIFVAL
jgi:hypothetical protein